MNINNTKIEVIEPTVLFPEIVSENTCHNDIGRGDWVRTVKWTPRFTQYDSVAKLLELYGRTCYKSEDRITDISARTFIPGIIKSGHESVI
jgi:hypothetical protein